MEKMKKGISVFLVLGLLLPVMAILCGCYTVAGATAGAAYGAAKDTKNTYNFIIEADNWFKTHAW